MFIINNTDYKDFGVKITWGEFVVSTNNKKRKGIAPFIQFCIDNNKYFGIETTLSKEMLKNEKISKKFNINEYISDLCYEDVNGWYSLILGKFNCDITRVSDTIFNLKLQLKCDEFEHIFIEIDINLKML